MNKVIKTKTIFFLEFILIATRNFRASPQNYEKKKKKKIN